MIPTLIDVDEYNIIFKKIGEDEMVYKQDINKFVENTGLTIQNVYFPIEGYYIKLSDINTTFSCGNIVENLFAEIKINDINDILIVMDFEGIEELTESFYQSYTKILLETSNKIISINMNAILSKGFSRFILSNIVENIEDEEEEEE